MKQSTDRPLSMDFTAALSLLVWSLFEPALGPFQMQPGTHAIKIKKPNNRLHIYCPSDIETKKKATHVSSESLIIFVHGGHGQVGTILPPHECPGTVSWADVGRRYASNGYRIALVDYPLAATPPDVRKWIASSILSLAAIFALVVLLLFYRWGSWFSIWTLPLLGAWLFFTVQRAFEHLAPPVSLQRSDVTLQSQVSAVKDSFRILHKDYHAKKVIVMGQGHGVLLATRALASLGSSFDCSAFVSIAGISDLPAFGRGWFYSYGTRLVERAYVEPLIGKDYSGWSDLTVTPLPNDATPLWILLNPCDPSPISHAMNPMMKKMNELRAPDAPPRTTQYQSSSSFGRGLASVTGEATAIVVRGLVHSPIKSK